MDKNKKFDNYLNTLFESDPQVPMNLDWDNMDIEIPDFKKKKRRLIVLFSFGLLITLSLAVMLSQASTSVDNTEITNNINVSTDSSHIVDVLEINRKVDSNSTMEIDPFLALDKDDSTNDSNLNLIVSKRQDISVQNATPNRNNKNLDTEISISKNIPFINVTDLVNQPQNLVFNPDFALNEKDKNQEKEKRNNIYVDNIDLKISSSTLEFSNINPSESVKSKERLLLDIGKLERDMSKNLLEERRIEFTGSAQQLGIKKDIINRRRNYSIVASSGIGQYELEFDNNILEDKVKNGYVHSYVLGVSLDFSNNWEAFILGRLDEYHSSFSHSRILETKYDTQNFKQINRKEITFHNNYSKLVGLQLGLEKKINLTNKINIGINLSIIPSYFVSISGKTTKGIESEILMYNETESRWSANSNIGVNANYSITRNVSLGVSFSNYRNLINPTMINEGIFSNSQNNAALVLKYHL